MIEIKNIEYVKPYMILKFDLISGTYRDVSSYEIAPVHIVNNQWVLTSAQQFHIQEIRDLVQKSHATVWKKSVINKYKKAKESELVLSYSEITLTDEQFNQILAVIPNSHYFDPNQSFIDKMKELYSGRHIIDCGAGNGHTGKILTDAGFKVTCIDIEPRNICEFPVTTMDATQFKFDGTMVCLICRPDKDDWFHQTIEKALQNNCPVVYVRKKNIISNNAQLIAEHVGKDDEFMFRIEL